MSHTKPREWRDPARLALARVEAEWLVAAVRKAHLQGDQFSADEFRLHRVVYLRTSRIQERTDALMAGVKSGDRQIAQEVALLVAPLLHDLALAAR